LKISSASTYTGLFGQIGSQGVVRDVTLKDADIVSTGTSTGVIVGQNTGTITNVKVIASTVSGTAFAGAVSGANSGTITGSQVHQSSVTGTQDVGGMLGINFGTVESSRVVETQVRGTNGVGGAVGDNQAAGGTIRWLSYSSSAASVSGTGASASSVGGLLGENGGTVRYSYAEGTVGNSASDSIVGAFSGSSSGTIENSFASGTVAGKSTVGGFVGMQTNGTIDRVYANVAALSTNVGGLIGQANVTSISGSVWNSSTGGTSWVASGSATTSGAAGISTTEMKTKSVFVNQGWDFDSIWSIADGEAPPRLDKPLNSLEASANGSPTPLYFYPYQYAYVLQVPASTAIVQLTATKSRVTDAVYWSGVTGAVYTHQQTEAASTATLSLSGNAATATVNVDRNGTIKSYAVQLYRPASADPPVTTDPVNRNVLEQAISAADDVLDGAEPGDEAGQYAQADINDLLSAIEAAQAVMDSETATQSEVDAAVTTLSGKVAAFRQAMIGVMLRFAEERFVDGQHQLALTFDYPVWDIADYSRFTLPSSGVTVLNGHVDPSDEHIVVLFLSGGLPAIGSVSVHAGAEAVYVQNEALNTKTSQIQVITLSDITQIRQNMLAGAPSPNSKLDISHVVMYMGSRPVSDPLFVRLLLRQMFDQH
jgi:hypothetical protein